MAEAVEVEWYLDSGMLVTGEKVGAVALSVLPAPLVDRVSAWGAMVDRDVICDRCF